MILLQKYDKTPPIKRDISFDINLSLEEILIIKSCIGKIYRNDNNNVKNIIDEIYKNLTSILENVKINSIECQYLIDYPSKEFFSFRVNKDADALLNKLIGTAQC